MRQIDLIPKWRKSPPKKWASTRTAVKNILAVYRLSHPLEREYGVMWYIRANGKAQSIARTYDLPLKVVCHVIAALSPVNRWTNNVMDAENMISAFMEGRENTKAYRTYPRNVAKASTILALHKRGLKWDHILKGPKVRSFAYNICYPASINPRVTVDVHAASICNRYRWTAKTLPTLRPHQYELYRQAYIGASKTLGIRPLELQAITWCVWRRLHRI